MVPSTRTWSRSWHTCCSGSPRENGWTKDALCVQHAGHEWPEILDAAAGRTGASLAQGAFDFETRRTDMGFQTPHVRAGRVPGVDHARARSSCRTSSAATSGRTSGSVSCWSRSCAATRSASVMLLKTGNDQIRFKPRPIEGVDARARDVEPKFLLLDGQQRLTSLTQALSGSGVVSTKDSRGKLLDRRYYIHMETALERRGPDRRGGRLGSGGRRRPVELRQGHRAGLSTTRRRSASTGYFPLQPAVRRTT